MTDLTPGERLSLLKKEHNGSLKDTQKSLEKYTHVVYDTDGEILYKGLGEPDMSNYDDTCKSYRFKTADAKILSEHGKSIAQFLIEEDEHDVCHIKVKEIESPKIKASRDFLAEITDKGNDYDIKIDSTITEWVVSKNSKIKLKQQLTFYVTPVGDPHILYERVVVPVESFIDNEAVIKKTSEVIGDYSLYTHKIFDKYTRT